MDASATVTLVREFQDDRALGILETSGGKWAICRRDKADGAWKRLETVAPFESAGSARSWINFLSVYP